MIPSYAMTASLRGMIKWVAWYACVARGIKTLSICIHKRKTLSLYAWISAWVTAPSAPHMKRCMSTTAHTPTRKVAWYGGSNPPTPHKAYIGLRYRYNREV